MPLAENEKALVVKANVERNGPATIAMEPPITITLRTFNKRGKKDRSFDKAFVERRLIPLKPAKGEADVLPVVGGDKPLVVRNPGVGPWSQTIKKLRDISQADTGNCGPNSVAFLRYGGGPKVDEAPKECGKPLTRGILRLLWLDMRAETNKFMVDIDQITTAIGECPPDHARETVGFLDDGDNGVFIGDLLRSLNQFAPVTTDGKRQKWVPHEPDAALDSRCETALLDGAMPNDLLAEVGRDFAKAVRDALAESPAGVIVGLNLDMGRWREGLAQYYEFQSAKGEATALAEAWSSMRREWGGHWIVITEVVEAVHPDFPGVPNFRIFDPNSRITTAHGPYVALMHAGWRAQTAGKDYRADGGNIAYAKPRSEDSAIKDGTSLGTIEGARDGQGLKAKKIVSLPSTALKASGDATYFNNYVEADAHARKLAKDSKNLCVVVECPPGTFGAVATDCSMETLTKRGLEEHETPAEQPGDYFEKFRYGVASVRFIGHLKADRFLVGDSALNPAEFGDGERVESPTHRTKTTPLYFLMK